MIALIDAGFMDKDTYQNTLFMVTAAIKQMPESDEKAALKEKEMKQLNETASVKHFRLQKEKQEEQELEEYLKQLEDKNNEY